MADEPLLTIEQLATVLRVPDELARQWEQDCILPKEKVAPDQPAKYRQRAVVHELRKHPEIMSAIKAAMNQRATRPPQ